MAAYVTSVTGLSNLPNLEIINFVANHLTSLDLSGCTNLADISLQNNQFTSLDASGCPNITSLNVGNNPDLASLTLPTFSFCTYFSAYGAALSTTTINNIFINLANQGTTGGYAFLDGGTNGVPDGAGLSAALYLSGDIGWSVTYNT